MGADVLEIDPDKTMQTLFIFKVTIRDFVACFLNHKPSNPLSGSEWCAQELAAVNSSKCRFTCFLSAL